MREKDILYLKENVFKIIGKDNALLTAGTLQDFNTMTIGWATMGVLWGKNVVIVYVRPTRHTYDLMESHDIFTVSFYEETFREKLSYLGTHSGKDEDKIKNCELMPLEVKDGGVTFGESRLTFVCKKIYFQDLNSEEIPELVIGKYYSRKDFHRFYIGEIVQLLEKERN